MADTRRELILARLKTNLDAITGAAFTQVTSTASQQKLTINANDVRRYVRAVGTLGGTSTPTFVYAVSMLYSKKYGN